MWELDLKDEKEEMVLQICANAIFAQWPVWNEMPAAVQKGVQTIEIRINDHEVDARLFFDAVLFYVDAIASDKATSLFNRSAAGQLDAGLWRAQEAFRKDVARLMREAGLEYTIDDLR